MAAIADDDEYAEAWMAQFGDHGGNEDGSKHRTMQGYSLVVAALHEIADRVGALYSVTVAVNSKNGKAPDIPPMPRPETAMQRHQAHSIVRRHYERAARVLPKKSDRGQGV
jgi:hypothetical protein